MLNDMMHEVQKSPKTATFLITHPDFSANDKDFIRRHDLATEYGERHIPSQALEVLPTFHADWKKFFLAGGNAIRELQVVRFGNTKDGKRTVTLELPDGFNEKDGRTFINKR